MNLFAFQLGREFKLSIAELLSVFPDCEVVYASYEILVMQGVTKENILKIAPYLGGTIKIIEIIKKVAMEEKATECKTKFKYGISVFGKGLNLRKILTEQKKVFKSLGISSRFVNKDFKNLQSAQILGEKLNILGTDYNYLVVPSDNTHFQGNEGTKYHFGKTIWVQNITAYSKRDYDKKRDMKVGMLPPKLAQIMINIAGGKKIYDPFVGLGSILIEAKNMGFQELYGSDISDHMVHATLDNLSMFHKKNIHTPERDTYIFQQNAKYIEEVDFLENASDITIVTEGYLGEIMTQKNISQERIQKQRKSLYNIYEGFFEGLLQRSFAGNIVISFPFWQIPCSKAENGNQFFYCEEIYNTLNKFCCIQNILPHNLNIKPTHYGSLLYKRDTQLVGREIFKLKIKK